MSLAGCNVLNILYRATVSAIVGPVHLLPSF